MRDLDQRSEEILRSLILEFIASGRAVGSATVAKRIAKSLSPATVRIVMGELERMGFLLHKHTSGGRIPTDMGFRYYVDKLLNIKPLSEDEIEEIRSRYNEPSYSVSSILKKTSKILSKLSRFAGLVVTPSVDDIVIKQIEFVSISRNRLLGIFVGVDGLVENRIVNIEGALTHSDLEKINNYCNRAFYGLTLAGAISKVEREILAAREEYDGLIAKALQLSQMMFVGLEKIDLVVDGGSQLLSAPDFGDSEKAASIIDLLEEKSRLIEILNKAAQSDSVNIFIGVESGFDAVTGCSLVTRSYTKGGRVLGTLGIIGPTRMDYSKVIPIVDCTAKLVSNFLSGENFL